MALPVSTDEGRQTVKVQVSAPGNQTAMQDVMVRANQLTSVDVQLVSR
jgi:hypothetical protein